MSSEDPIAAFRVEAGEALDEVESALLDLGGRLDDMALINRVFRGLHTVKGSGAMFGFDALAAFTHHCETAFDKVRKRQVAATAELVSVILAACDHMRALLANNAPQAAGEALLARLSTALAAAQGTTAAPRLITPPGGGQKLSFHLPGNAMVNGTNPLALLAELRELGALQVMADTSTLPPFATMDPTLCHIGWTVVLPPDTPGEAVEDVFLFVLDDMVLSLERIEAPSTAHADDNPAPARTADAPQDRPAAARQIEAVRVPADRLDAVMNKVGELVIAQSRLSQIAGGSPDLALRAVAEEIERLSSDLRSTIMVLRMVPIANLFGRFRRLVHDLADETGKEIDLVTNGEGTEVDKTVVERLFDPILHLIRNSCDHGLEDAETRRAAGKPAAGTVRLTAHHAAGQVVITITDDGRGIDVGRVRARAQEQGLIEPGEQISDQDMIQYIFHPGLSTAAKVTNLSGRGVGMDVVKRTIEGLRGTINVTTRPGQGSSITLRIPLTLAIIEGLLVRVGEGRYVLPLSAVEECLELGDAPQNAANRPNLITLRDRLVPLLPLRDAFGATTPPDRFQKVVVVSAGDISVGLVVDQIIGSHQTVIKSMSALHRGVDSFAGATILGDGTVALILDIGHLLAAASPREERLRAVG